MIELVTVTREQDEYGVWRPTEEPKTKQIYCQVDSVTQTEFFEAGRNGLNPEFRFTVFFGDYSNEPIVIYKGNRYAVYRTYLTRNDRLELYVERKGGTNGESDT